jgi:hypothetical protein
MSFNSTGRVCHSTALDEHVIQEHWASMSFDAANDRHHRVAGVDIGFIERWPTPLRCMAWLRAPSCCRALSIIEHSRHPIDDIVGATYRQAAQLVPITGRSFCSSVADHG